MKFIPNVGSHFGAVSCRGVSWFYDANAVRAAKHRRFSADYPVRSASIRLIRDVR
jgi:hypothetical protein